MTRTSIAVAATLAALLSSPTARAQAGDPTVAPPAASYGHSAHGAAYDVGPRQRPWPIAGIGRAHFPVTSDHPDVQGWFDQANALLHSFWYYEAERALRWCTVLDPDCAMAYLWLSRCAPYDRERAREFLAEAVARKDHASPRERRYIEAWENAYLPSVDQPRPKRPGWNATSRALADELEKIVLEYPDDVEAKTLYVLNSLFESGRYGLEAVLQEVLAAQPDHPGAHHYRIHNWDTPELGHVALESCAKYGRIAAEVGHANHMPGHIYTKLGMWHEGAIWLDAATRVEKAYMQDRLVLPFHAWNYAHNRNFLANAQSMLGLPSAALQGAYDLLNAPLDPEFNEDEGGHSVFRQGLSALRRTLVRFERWEEILEPGRIPWREEPADELWRTYCEALAHLGTGAIPRAEELVLELIQLEGGAEDGPAESAGPGNPQPRELLAMMRREAEGRLRLQRGETTHGLQLLIEAADLEFEHRVDHNDPPTYPRSLYNVLGEAYLDLDSPRLAIAAFEKALESVRNNGFSWAGLARAHHALGNLDEARRAYGRMLHVWSHAEAEVWQAAKAHELGLSAEPEDISPAPQRNYATETLASLGPNTWQPYPAPDLAAVDPLGQPVSLAQFRGKNVLLVFYLSDQCVHCVEQLQEIDGIKAKLAERDTVVLAISSDPPERNAQNDLSAMAFTLLSDQPTHDNAIRFRSYDEFEELELHSTHLIDRQGRLRWVRTGGEPFTDMGFLLAELDRIDAIEKAARLMPVNATAIAPQKDN